MSENEIEQEKIAEAAEAGSGTKASSEKLTAEAVAQLSDKPGRYADSIMSNIEQSSLSNYHKLSDKERNEAVTGLGKDLEAMVKGDIPHLRQRMKELGVSTAELDKVEKELSKKVEAAKPLEEAILKGDAKALQKMVATMDPKQLEEITELIQKHLDKNGMGIEVDYTDGKLIISRTNGDRAVAISKDKLDVIGVNKDGSYDFSRHYRRENPGRELQGMADGAVTNYIYPPRHRFDDMYIKPYPIEYPQGSTLKHTLESSTRPLMDEKHLPTLNILDSSSDIKIHRTK